MPSNYTLSYIFTLIGLDSHRDCKARYYHIFPIDDRPVSCPWVSAQRIWLNQCLSYTVHPVPSIWGKKKKSWVIFFPKIQIKSLFTHVHFLSHSAYSQMQVYTVNSIFFLFLSFFFFFFFVLLGLHLWHMEVPRLGVKSELQLPVYTTATAMPGPSFICDLHHSPQQCQILNPLNEAWDETWGLPVRFVTVEPWQNSIFFFN